MKQLRYVLWIGVALAALVLAYVSLRPPSQNAQEASKSVAGSHFGGPFTLVGADGQPFSSSQLSGKPYVLYFGYTRCPDTCPTTLNRLVHLRRQVGLGDDSFKIVFITVDPQRDGPKEVGSYQKAFGAPIIGLTGSPTQIDQVKKEYGIFSQKVPEAGGDYSVDHTATVLLFDRDGKFAGTIAPDEPDTAALGKLRNLTAA
ncbi:MAG TPA: SCO family protein [Sphingomicrobium sp.]|nr:SCO family protein [Sphingomicrobium sp.]